MAQVPFIDAEARGPEEIRAALRAAISTAGEHDEAALADFNRRDGLVTDAGQEAAARLLTRADTNPHWAYGRDRAQRWASPVSGS